ncbi:MAG: hypothetical protein R6V23_00765 [Bacteroidales bacterium]
MKIKSLLLSAFIFISMSLAAQNHEHEHELDHQHKHHYMYELGISNGVVYNATEKEFAYGAHVHFIRTIGESQKLGIGIGYERIFDDHKHNALNIILHYRPAEHLSLNIAPGVVWLDSEKNSLKPGLHIEGLYEFELGRFHIGPIIGIGFNTEDLHASLGLHLAVGF